MAENEVAAVPAAEMEGALVAAGVAPADMPLALRIWFDDPLFARVRVIAGYMAKAEGVTPQHLLGKPEACFFVVQKSLVWSLDPSAVASATYMTPGGRIGYEGKLCHAIMEGGKRLAPGSGGVRYEHFGPWENVEGKFTIATSSKGNQYAKATWTRADTQGVGVYVRAHLRGERDERFLKFNLEQAFPLNSTLWATDPRTQICYLAVRRFASLVAPSLIMGVPFDGTEPLEDDEVSRANRARDVTPPAPTRAEFESPVGAREAPAAQPEARDAEPPAQVLTVTSVPDGEVAYEGEDPIMFRSTLMELATKAKGSKTMLGALWENNSPDFFKLPPAMAQDIRDSWPGGAPAAQAGLKGV